MSMRIATYNVNGINGRLANLPGWLEEAAPDIVCLQELKAPDDKFPAAVLRAAGYGAVWHGQKSWNGVAILARGAEPMETRGGLPGDPNWMISSRNVGSRLLLGQPSTSTAQGRRS
jgi:exodeoxyribonuclease III